MSRMGRMAVLVMAAMMLMTAVASAQTTTPLEKKFGYSGFLAEKDGLGVLHPVQGTRSFEFRVFDVETDGDPLGNLVITKTGVRVTNGEFSVELDLPNANIDFYTEKQYWLEITVGLGGTPLSPRKKLLFVPYAIRSDIEVRTSDPTTDLYTGRMWLKQ